MAWVQKLFQHLDTFFILHEHLTNFSKCVYFLFLMFFLAAYNTSLYVTESYGFELEPQKI